MKAALLAAAAGKKASQAGGGGEDHGTGPISVVGSTTSQLAGAPAAAVNYPAFSAGDRLLLIGCTDGARTVSSYADIGADSWTPLDVDNSVQSTGVLAYLDATEDQIAGTCTITIDGSEPTSWRVLRIQGYDPTLAPEFSKRVVTSQTSTVDFAPLDVSWPQAETLWVYACASDGWTTEASASPADYGNKTSLRSGTGTGNCALSVGYKIADTDNEDPTGLVISEAQPHVAYVVGVAPGATP